MVLSLISGDATSVASCRPTHPPASPLVAQLEVTPLEEVADRKMRIHMDAFQTALGSKELGPQVQRP